MNIRSSYSHINTLMQLQTLRELNSQYQDPSDAWMLEGYAPNVNLAGREFPNDESRKHAEFKAQKKVMRQAEEALSIQTGRDDSKNLSQDHIEALNSIPIIAGKVGVAKDSNRFFEPPKDESSCQDWWCQYQSDRPDSRW